MTAIPDGFIGLLLIVALLNRLTDFRLCLMLKRYRDRLPSRRNLAAASTARCFRTPANHLSIFQQQDVEDGFWGKMSNGLRCIPIWAKYSGSRREVNPNPRPLAPFLAYVVAFHLLWIAWPFFLYPKLLAVGNTTATYAVLNLAFRFVYWITPVLLSLRSWTASRPLSI